MEPDFDQRAINHTKFSQKNWLIWVHADTPPPGKLKSWGQHCLICHVGNSASPEGCQYPLVPADNAIFRNLINMVKICEINIAH